MYAFADMYLCKRLRARVSSCISTCTWVPVIVFCSPMHMCAVQVLVSSVLMMAGECTRYAIKGAPVFVAMHAGHLDRNCGSGHILRLCFTSDGDGQENDVLIVEGGVRE